MKEMNKLEQSIYDGYKRGTMGCAFIFIAFVVYIAYLFLKY